MNEDIKINIGGVNDLPGTDDVVQENVSIPVPKTQKQNSFSKQEFAEAVALAIQMTQSQAHANQSQEAFEKKLEAESRNMNVAGQASQVFSDKIKQEVAEGKGIRFTYYPALAKQFGKIMNISISGYSMGFIEGQTTFVPQSLVTALNMRLGGANAVNTLIENRISGFSERGGAKNQELTDKVSQVMDNLLPRR